MMWGRCEDKYKNKIKIKIRIRIRIGISVGMLRIMIMIQRNAGRNNRLGHFAGFRRND